MRRRRFLQNLVWLTGGLLVGCNKKTFSGSEGKKLVKGYVRSGGQGIANVVVSDGYNVVTTNERGAYEFEVHPEATSVFVSTPAGFNFISDTGIARHYYLLNEANKKNINFELQSLGRNDNEHQFIIWADPQVK